MRQIRVAAIALCGAAVSVSGLEAQTIRGQVVDAASSEGIAQASVEVVRDEETVERAVTDGVGWFEVGVPSEGRYRLRVSALGYEALDSEPIEVNARELVEVTVRLGDQPIELDGITVEARRRDPIHAATYEGLYARRAAFPTVGSRRVVLRTDPEMANASRVADVLRWFPSTRSCVDFYVNGEPRDGFLWGILDLPPGWLEGIEFYRDGYLAPIDYVGGRCQGATASYSVIAVWHDRAEARDD